ncbi:hypothetical protein [Marilutibacter alkalisoli]|uniref:Secreted protein n=1 Tax=Marilutibacter alkalisoli TaxID=2591633 RepID=A0A514BTW8_9GAMM|nr:hypothetical protein [Lysobacter alkalisoli]QDH70820.1 hypothetical protein FKV23_12565 [Lysobacter alkalisoli]
MLPKPRLLLPLAIVAALALAPAAFAQQSAPPIEQEMSAGEFRAAGLDKLSPEELANLNRWLDRKVETVAAEVTAQVTEQVTEQAREEGRKEVVEKNRGFLTFGSNEPITGVMAGSFRGFGKGRVYTLDNGQVWEQVDDVTLAGVRNPNPNVTIRPSLVGNVWYMSIEGYNKRAKVRRVK